MKHHLRLCLGLVLLVLCFASCGTRDDIQFPQVDESVEGTAQADPYQTALRVMWLSGQHAHYDSISGTIDVELGGSLVGTTSSFGTREFRIDVNKNAFDWRRESYSSKYVPFTIYIPKDIGQVDYPPPFYKLCPPGIDFLNDVTVTLYWPDWCTHGVLPGATNSNYYIWNLSRDVVGSSIFFHREAVSDELLPSCLTDEDEAMETIFDSFTSGGIPIGEPIKNEDP